MALVRALVAALGISLLAIVRGGHAAVDLAQARAAGDPMIAMGGGYASSMYLVGRACFDPDGDPYLENFVELAGGVSPRNFGAVLHCSGVAVRDHAVRRRRNARSTGPRTMFSSAPVNRITSA